MKNKRTKDKKRQKKKVLHYKKMKKLGEGAYGMAYLCQCIETKQLCVIKQIDLKDMAL